MPHYIVESYKSDPPEPVPYDRRPIKASGDEEAVREAAIVPTITEPRSYKVVAIERSGRKESRRVIYDSAKQVRDA